MDGTPPRTTAAADADGPNTSAHPVRLPAAAATTISDVPRPDLGPNAFPVRDDVSLSELASRHRTLPRRLLWVDSNASNENNRLQKSVEAIGIHVTRCTSTEEAMAALDGEKLKRYIPLSQSRFRIMSNNVRPEGPGGAPDFQAGLRMARRVREKGYTGPFLVFCGDTKNAEATLACQHHVMVTDSKRTADRFATFQPIYDKFECCSEATMFPDFGALKAEKHVDRREIAESDVIKLIQDAKNAQLRARLICGALGGDDEDGNDLRSAIKQMTKYHIGKECRSHLNTTLSSQLFQFAEDLVYQYVPQAERDRTPTVERVIAIDNHFLRKRFQDAMRDMARRQCGEPAAAAAAMGGPARRDIALTELITPDITDVRSGAKPRLLFYAADETCEKILCTMSVPGNCEVNGVWENHPQLQRRGVYFSSVAGYIYWRADQPERQSAGKRGNMCIVAAWVLLDEDAQATYRIIPSGEGGGGLSRQNTDDTDDGTARRRADSADAGSLEWYHCDGPAGDEVFVSTPEHIAPLFVIELNSPGSRTAHAVAGAVAAATTTASDTTRPSAVM